MRADAVLATVELFANELAANVDQDLECVAVYGSMAKDDYDEATSDHNVAIVLADANAALLRLVADTLKLRRPSDRTRLLILTPEEIDNARDVFPIRLRDLSRHHRVVLGTDRLEGIEVAREHLALDCENQLRSLLVQLRGLFVEGSSDREKLKSNLVLSFRSFLPPMAALLDLAQGRDLVRRADIVQAAIAFLEVEAQPLEGLLRMSREPGFNPRGEEMNALLDGYMRILKVAAWKADQL